ncbi:MAG: phosphotransferase [Flavobacteriales bacterium]|nr:phosphotransferase [Flavobacteriales bacterium]
MLSPLAKLATRATLHHRYEPETSWLEAWRLALSIPLERRRQYQLAHQAVERYDLPGAELRFLSASGNLVFRIDHDGHGFALRIGGPGRRTVEQVEAELAYGNELRSALGIRTPEAVAGHDGQLVQALPGDDGRTRLVVLFTWMTGEAYGDEPTPRQMELLGRLQARMHAFALEHEPAYARDRHRLTADQALRWNEVPRTGEPVLQDTDWALVQRMGHHLRERIPDLFTRSPKALVHFDLQGGNLLLDGDDLGIIDLDDCLTAPVVLGMATALTYTTTKPDADDLRRAFLAGHAAVHTRAAELEDLLDPAIALIALREVRRVLGWERITSKPWGPLVLQESLRVLRAMAHRMGVQVEP